MQTRKENITMERSDWHVLVCACERSEEKKTRHRMSLTFLNCEASIRRKEQAAIATEANKKKRREARMHGASATHSVHMFQIIE